MRSRVRWGLHRTNYGAATFFVKANHLSRRFAFTKKVVAP